MFEKDNYKLTWNNLVNILNCDNKYKDVNCYSNYIIYKSLIFTMDNKIKSGINVLFKDIDYNRMLDIINILIND